MDLSLNYTSESDSIKSQNSQGKIGLVLGYNGKPYDLHVIADNKITAKIGNAEGYIQDIIIDISNEDDDDKYSGRFTIPLSDPNIQNLPPDIYYIEVWINTNDAQGNQQQLIFPSDRVLSFTLNSNIVNGSNSMPMITYDNIQKDWASFKNFVLQHNAQLENDLAEMDDATDSFNSNLNSQAASAASNINFVANSAVSLINQGTDDDESGSETKSEATTAHSSLSRQITSVAAFANQLTLNTANNDQINSLADQINNVNNNAQAKADNAVSTANNNNDQLQNHIISDQGLVHGEFQGNDLGQATQLGIYLLNGKDVGGTPDQAKQPYGFIQACRTEWRGQHNLIQILHSVYTDETHNGNINGSLYYRMLNGDGSYPNSWTLIPSGYDINHLQSEIDDLRNQIK